MVKILLGAYNNALNIFLNMMDRIKMM